MLQADEIEAMRGASEQLLDPIVNYLIQDIAKRVAEAGQFTATAQYQVWRAQNLGVSQQEIKKRVAKLLNISQKEAEQLFTQAAKTGYDFDMNSLPTAKAIPFQENAVIQQIVRASVEMANAELKNITQTMGFCMQDGTFLSLTDAYIRACDTAFLKVSTGAEDYNTAIRNALTGLKKSGIQYIDYSSGRHYSVEAAVRRNVFSAAGIMQENISQHVHDKTGCDGWEISAHAASAPDHEPIQGKQYSDADYQALNNSLVRRIGTLNCGHGAYPIVMGVSRPQYSERELEQLRKENERGIEYDGKHYSKYEATQRQRKLERAIRNNRRKLLIDKTVNDTELLQADRIKEVRLEEEYKRFSKEAGLKLQYERMEMTGYGPKQAVAAERAASMAEKENIVNENSPRSKKKVDYAVDWETVQSEEYSNRFDQLSSSDRANSAVRTRAKWALNNRDGARTEELYAVDMRDGSEIARITDQHYQQGVKRTEQFEKAIGLAGKTGSEIMLIHNHPAGSPPSIGDLNALLSTPNAQGITVGHNGSIYRYTAPKKKIPQADFEVAYRKNSMYTDITAYEKALEELSEVYGFTFERL